MTRTLFRSALAASAVLSLSLLAAVSAAQDCPNCPHGGESEPTATRSTIITA